MISAVHANIAPIASSVNVQTEQVAHDNKVRSPVSPATAVAKQTKEKKLKSGDKRWRGNAWEAAEHPDYDVEEDIGLFHHEHPKDTLDRMFSLVSLKRYSREQGKGYAMRFKLPARILNAAITESQMERRRAVIKYYYHHATAPHSPSEVIAIL